ncbi:MAG: hypothetical protein V4489_08295 [Chlamydiota bacterium]
MTPVQEISLDMIYNIYFTKKPRLTDYVIVEGELSPPKDPPDLIQAQDAIIILALNKRIPVTISHDLLHDLRDGHLVNKYQKTPPNNPVSIKQTENLEKIKAKWSERLQNIDPLDDAKNTALGIFKRVYIKSHIWEGKSASPSKKIDIF